jgi:hypothetical protein
VQVEGLVEELVVAQLAPKVTVVQLVQLVGRLEPMRQREARQV